MYFMLFYMLKTQLYICLYSLLIYYIFQTKLSPGLALKKKNIPSLVEKWQKIKEEQDKEDKNTEDPRN